jgi:hypothetical protein
MVSGLRSRPQHLLPPIARRFNSRRGAVALPLTQGGPKP